MEKKLKYLLGCFVFGFGLLFSSQSFALNYITVDGVTEGSLYSNTGRSANYRYIFAFDSHTVNGTATPYSRQFGFSVYYDGLTKYNYYPYQRKAGVCPSNYSEFQIRTGRTSNNWYTGNCSRFSANIYSFENMPQLAWNDKGSYDRNIRVLLGQDDLFGNAFVVVGVPDSSSDNISPIYSMGAGNLTYENYMPVNENYSDYYRFFYKNTGGVSALKTSWSNSNFANLNYNSWEYFYSRGTRTNYGYIVDDGSVYTKYKHFGLFDMGYSYVYGKVAQSSTALSWNELGFRTVSDEVETALKIYGDVSYDNLQNYSANGILLLRGNQYLSMGNDDGVYLLSKDGRNPSRVIYEHWNCNIDNVNLLFSGGYESSPCVRLDGGYLTYNGSTEVLPFTDFSTPVSINTLDSNHPLLYDLTNGGMGLTKMAGQVTRTDSSCIKINSDRCYGFISNNYVNLHELYLNGGTTVSMSNQMNSGFLSNCASNSSFYQNNFVVCSALLQSIGNPVQIPGSYDQYVSYGYDNSGSLTIWVTSQDDLVEQMSGYEWVQNYDGSRSTVCVSDYCNPNQNTGIVETGTLGVTYYENFFESGMFFRCPYSYRGFNFTIGSRLADQIGIDILSPINCMIAGYIYGKDYHIFNSSGTVLNSRLFNSEDYKSLYNFFDVVISLGILFLMFRIYRLIK